MPPWSASDAALAVAPPEPTVDIEALKWLAVQLLALAEQCTDLLPLQRDLRNLADDLVDLIEGAEQPEEARRSH